MDDKDGMRVMDGELGIYGWSSLYEWGQGIEQLLEVLLPLPTM